MILPPAIIAEERQRFEMHFSKELGISVSLSETQEDYSPPWLSDLWRGWIACAQWHRNETFACDRKTLHASYTVERRPISVLCKDCKGTGKRCATWRLLLIKCPKCNGTGMKTVQVTMPIISQ